MQAIKVACPLCLGMTGVNDSSPLGKSVHCQKCGAPFTIGADDIRRANLELPEGGAMPAAAAAPVNGTPWWVEAEVAATPPKSTMPVRMGVLAAPLSAPKTPAQVAAKAPYQLPQRPEPAVAAPALKNNHARVRPLVAYGLLGGGMLVVLGFGVALAITCCVNPSADEENTAQTTSYQDTVAPKTTKKAGSTAQKPPVDELPGNVQPPAQPEPEKVVGPTGNPPPGNPPPPLPDGQKNPGPMPPIKPNPVPEQPAKLVRPAPANKHVVSAAKQKEIDKAIENGVKYIKTCQWADGSFVTAPVQFNGHVLGTTALCALALMESGVAPDDPGIVKAANYVRKYWKDNRMTYEMSLAILFLDKLGEKSGEKKDKGIIQGLAVRLIHAQNNVGGWHYTCQPLNTTETTQYLNTLRKNRPRLPSAIIKDKDVAATLPAPLSLPEQIRLLNPLEKATGLVLPAGIDKSKTGAPPPAIDKTKPSGQPQTLEQERTSAPKVVPAPEVDNPRKKSGEKAQVGVPGKQPPKGGPGPLPLKGPKDLSLMPNVADDNSNTQFAILALWAARRHEVPVENALLLSEMRFRTSQLITGGWGYHFLHLKDTPSMTCVGLLGLALGKGVTAELQIKAGQMDVKTILIDEQVRKGLTFLLPHLEKQNIQQGVFPLGLSLYYMWSLERVAVLYDLVKIGDRDWYLWGTDILLPTQQANGSWQTGSYHGSNATIDTCLALLFLKRVNFVQDLTDLLLPIPISESNSKQ